MNPSVSVIIPVYNGEKFIGQTIYSVLKQNYPNLEYIIIDDGSTDKTEEIISCRFRGYPLKYIKQSNMGEQLSVNKGLMMAQGNYIMVVNADDPLLPNAISTLVNVMESKLNLIAAYPNWASINEDGSYRSKQNNGDYNYYKMVVYHKCLPSVGTIVRREWAVSHNIYRNPEYKYIGDYDYWLRLGLYGNIFHVPKQLAMWRHSTNQMTSKRKAFADEHIKVISNLYSNHADDLPNNIKSAKNKALFWANLVAFYLSRKPYYIGDAIGCSWQEIVKPVTYYQILRHGSYILSR